MLGGLLAAKAGEIVVEGTLLNHETIHQLRPRMGMVFQNPDNQFIGSTVEEDIAFGLEGRCLPREEMIDRVRKYGDKLEIGHLLSRHPSELSGGQKQRVAVAAILAMEPGIVIFDEASSMLDEKARGELLDIIKEMRQSGEYTIVSITHDAEEILASDRAVVLLDGGVAADLVPEDLFHNDELLQSCRLVAPYRIQLVRELARLGVHIPPPLQREEEVAEALWQLHLNK
ncbi:Energy-coupling factor transporter ATP-binding protein EcfA1 [compost metagenome]